MATTKLGQATSPSSIPATDAPMSENSPASGTIPLEAPLWHRLARQYRTEIAIFLAAIALEVIVGLFQPQAWTFGNFVNIAQAGAPLALMAIGELLVIVTGGIDLSVGSVFSLCGMVAALAMVNHFDPVTSTVLALLVGALIGGFNGFFVSVVGLAPFVVTLVSYAIAGSLAYVITNGNSLPLPDLSYSALDLGHLIPGIPNYMLYPALLLVVVEICLNRATFGRWIYAVGSNDNAARLIGIPVRRVRLSVYIIAGLLAAFASILSLSYLANAESTAGAGLMLPAIASVVIGGASLFGGTGSAVGAFLGALMITEIQNGVNLIGINSFWEGSITGLVILFAVLIDRAGSKQR